MYFVMSDGSPINTATTGKLITHIGMTFQGISDKYTARRPLAEHSRIAESFNVGFGTFITYLNGK